MARLLKLLGCTKLLLGTICEVGCGEILVQLAAALPPPAQLTGFDISRNAIASRKQTERIHRGLRSAPGPWAAIRCWC